jgi:hypothetical protein
VQRLGGGGRRCEGLAGWRGEPRILGPFLLDILDLGGQNININIIYIYIYIIILNREIFSQSVEAFSRTIKSVGLTREKVEYFFFWKWVFVCLIGLSSFSPLFSWGPNLCGLLWYCTLLGLLASLLACFVADCFGLPTYYTISLDVASELASVLG